MHFWRKMKKNILNWTRQGTRFVFFFVNFFIFLFLRYCSDSIIVFSIWICLFCSMYLSLFFHLPLLNWSILYEKILLDNCEANLIACWKLFDTLFLFLLLFILDEQNPNVADGKGNAEGREARANYTRDYYWVNVSLAGNLGFRLIDPGFRHLSNRSFQEYSDLRRKFILLEEVLQEKDQKLEGHQKEVLSCSPFLLLWVDNPQIL